MKYESLPRIRIKRSSDFHTTWLSFANHQIQFNLRITSKLSKQQRRLMAVSFFRQFREWVPYLLSAEISHLDDESNDYRRIMERGVFLSEGTKVTSELGSLGYRIRMSRLNLGWTQKFLAERAGISVSQLSEIERGVVRARKTTLAAIFGAFESSVRSATGIGN